MPIRASRSVLAPAQLIAAAIAVAALTAACRQPEAAPSAPAGASAAPTPDAAPTAAATAPGGSTAVPSAAVPAGQVPAPIAAILEEIKRGDKEQLAISPEDGQFLRMLVASTGRKRALEIGAAQGYSAIWIGMAMRDTGGKLVTIEYDPQRAKEAAANVKRAGLDDVVTVIGGDAFVEIPKLAGTFDCVFVDAWKRDYIKFFDLTYPRLDDGGLFLGHNVINKKSEMSDFLDRIATHPDLFTSVVAPGGEGVSISYKRRARS
jgi:predicted O-methyltransferase YrrM